MTDYRYNSPVFIKKCDTYDENMLCGIIRDGFRELSLGSELFENKVVLIKPNLVLAKAPDHAATTHPAFVRATARILRELGAKDVILADSPGGPYNAAALSRVYSVCGMEKAAWDGLFRLNDNFGFSPVFPNLEKLKTMDIIDVLSSADVIIDLCRLKTHTLTGMSCAVKNLFGLIPGVEKFQMHSNFPEIQNFSAMLTDLAEFTLTEKKFIAICDAVIGMEGNGPSYGTPKFAGLTLISESPFSLDIIAERIINGKNGGAQIPYLDIAAERGLVPRDWKSITVLGDIDYDAVGFKTPDTNAGLFLKKLPDMFGGRIAGLFSARPYINKKKCIGCGKCASSCPRHTISIVNSRGKKLAKIDPSGCIRCYCCSELCPIGAVDTKKNILIKLIH